MQLIDMQKEYSSPFIVLDRIARIMQSKFLQEACLFNNKTLFFLLKKDFGKLWRHSIHKMRFPNNSFQCYCYFRIISLYFDENLIHTNISRILSALNYSAFYSVYQERQYDLSHVLDERKQSLKSNYSPRN